MTRVHVPQLQKKFDDLVKHGGAKSFADIARRLNRSESTLKGWMGSDSRVPADTVTKEGMPDLVALFADALPDLDTGAVEALLRGPAEDVELELSNSAVPSFLRLVDREARRSVGELVPARRAQRDLIELSSPPERPSQASIQRDHDFRIAFKTRGRGRFVLAAQAAPSGWGLVPCSLGKEDGKIHLPGMIDGALNFMRERREVGRHLFIAAHATQAFAPVVRMALRDGAIFDAVLIRHFVRHFEALPKSSRWLFAMDVDVTEAPPAQDLAEN